MTEFDDNFEQELRDALRARPAPPGFADRVMRRVGDPAARVPVAEFQTRRSLSAFHLPALQWAIAAVLLIAIAVGGFAEHRRRLAGERARQQVFLALRITSSTLHAVHNKIVDSDESD